MKTCNCEGCELKSLFFDKVSAQIVENMCTSKIERHYEKGEHIISEGEPIVEFSYLKSGLVKLYRKGSNDKEQIITFAGPFDFVSLLSLFSEAHFKYSVAALEDSVTCNISLKAVKEIAASNAAFTLNLLEKTSKATDKIIIDSLEIKQRRLMGRIAYILLYFAKDVYQKNSFDLPVSRKEIAEYIGMTTENVIRTLSDFRKDGIIHIYGHRIEIVDEERLRRIKDFS
jgi:CRP-like cAMP-binding protein